MSKAWTGQGQKGSHGSGERVWARIIPNPKLKLLDQCREVMRLKHYSIRTERCYCDWIRRYIHFHRMEKREKGSQFHLTVFQNGQSHTFTLSDLEPALPQFGGLSVHSAVNAGSDN